MRPPGGTGVRSVSVTGAFSVIGWYDGQGCAVPGSWQVR